MDIFVSKSLSQSDTFAGLKVYRSEFEAAALPRTLLTASDFLVGFRVRGKIVGEGGQ